jgi:hypothetical protein
MGRVLTMVATTSTAHERDAVIARARARREIAKSLGCNYWVFEQRASVPTFVEFFEAGDDETLHRAQLAAGAWSDSHPILREVEL